MHETAYRWLVSDAARPFLELANENVPPTPKLVARLRKKLTVEQANLVCQQAELRQRARSKFSRADEMFFTSVGYEQSTDERIAKYKFDSLDSKSILADLCCGIGGDSIAMARRGSVVAVDRDAACAVFAGANLAANGCDGNVVCGDIARVSIREFGAWHIDPDRRPGNRRTTSVEDQEPRWGTIESLLTENPHALIKLAPAAEPPHSIAASAECEWIGSRRECKQLLIRCGDLARHPGRRTATIVDDASGLAPRTLVSENNNFVSDRDHVGRYLYEPHPTLLAAGIVQDLAAELGLHSFILVSPGSSGAAWGYLTSDDLIEAHGFTGFQVESCLPFDRKQLTVAATQNQWHVQEIKKRGVRESPQQIRSWFSKSNSANDDKITLIVAPTVRGVRAMFARRMTGSHGTS